MAIRIIQGVPGSGKTYYAVRHLAKNYCDQAANGEYYLKPEVTVFTNIDGFKPDHHDLKKAIQEAGGPDDFFCLDNQKIVTDSIGGQIVYIIDEAQRYWRKGDRGRHKAYEYFELHRHFGHDVYLITQDVRKLPGDLACLAEYIVDAAPRSRSFAGEMKYKWLSDGEVIKREAWKSEQAIFNLYKSMDMGESEKIKNPVVKTVISVFAVVAFIVSGGFYYFKVKFYDGNKKTQSSNDTQVVQKNSVRGSVSSVSLGQLVTVPVSFISESFKSSGFTRKQEFVIFQGIIYERNSYPYSLRRVAGQWLSEVPANVINKEEKDESRRGSDERVAYASGASGAAHAREDEQ